MKRLFFTLLAIYSWIFSFSQVNINILTNERHQVIDGFGAHQGNADVQQSWWNNLYFEDAACSIFRIDLTPRFTTPYSDLSYFSPWFMGSGTDSVFNLEDTDNPDGPEGNRVRTYTGPNDYSRTFGGQNAPIAVMGPDIDANVNYFTYSSNRAIETGKAQKEALGDFKLIGSFWSPVPWVKVSSGNNYPQNWWPGPVIGSPWPFIWGGNFAGGRLDVSGELLDVFDDSALGGTGPTSSLTQYARSTAAYIRGFQNFHNIKFYAISLQNELNFEQFYNSATYPLASQYIAALKTVKKEFEKYDDLKDIKIMGPEDLLGGDAYGLWQFGGGENTTHKNLQYLQEIAADLEAEAALDFFCIHGYDDDGVSTAGSDPVLWDWWTNGWANSPAPGIPGNKAGFTSYGKKSWMTETSGELHPWLSPTNGFPNNGGWSIALKMHQAFTTGQESAWIYWTFSEDENGNASPFALTNASKGANSPKYVAFKHFSRYIRPNAVRVSAMVSNSDDMLASAYIHDEEATLTLVLINTSVNNQLASINIPDAMIGSFTLEAFTSSEGNYWQQSELQIINGIANVNVPAYGIVTLTGTDLITSTNELANAYNFKLYQNQPNPFSESTIIQFQLDQREKVELNLYDLQGKLIRTLIKGLMPEGNHQYSLKANDLAEGVYLYQLKIGDQEISKRMIVVK